MKFKNKKIALVIPTFTGGGMERVMSELANYFNGKGCEVHILFLIKHKPFYKIDENIKVYFPAVNEGADNNRGVFYWLIVLKYLRNTIKNINPDTVFSIPQGYSNLTILALLGTKIPVFISDRNSPKKPVPFRSRVLRRICYPMAKGIILQTEIAKKLLLNSGVRNNNIAVIANPLRDIKVNSSTNSTSLQTILNVGRFVMEKNQLELIDVFSNVDNTNWRLVFVGDGPLKSKLVEKINLLGLEDKIILKNPTPNIDKEMSQANIFAFSSIYEGFPNALSEALAHGIPCISYDCIAGPSEMIVDGVNGYLVQIKNKSQYKNKLEKLMVDENLRIAFSERANNHRQKFSKETIGGKYLKFILSK